MTRTWTEKEVDEARQWVARTQEAATQLFRMQDAIKAPVVEILATRDSATGRRCAEVRSEMVLVDPAVMSTGPEKDRLVHWLRRLTRLSDAVGFAMIKEIWTLDVQGMDILPKSLENAAGRGEALTIIYQHRALGPDTHATRRVIKRWRDKVKLGPWEYSDRVGGRFADILSPPEDEAFSDEMLSGMIRTCAHMTPEERRQKIDKVVQRSFGSQTEAATRVSLWMIGRLRDLGCEVASRPEDILRSSAAVNNGPTVEWVNLSVEVPSKG